MRRPPDDRRKRKAARTIQGGLRNFDSFGGQIDRREYNPNSPFSQGLTSYAPLPCPVALAGPFGFCFAVFVRRERGIDPLRAQARDPPSHL